MYKRQAHGAGDEGVGEGGEGGAEAFGEHLLVAVDAQLGGEPLQLVAERIGDAAVEHLAVRPEGTAQSAGGDPHAVDAVGQVPAYGGVELDEGRDLAAYVGEDVVTGGARGGFPPLRARWLVRSGLGQGPGEFGRCGRRPDAGLAQPPLDGVEEGGVGVVGQFVPEQQTDFVFTVAGEELGFLGAGLIIVLLGVVLWRACRIARGTTELYGTVVAAGIIAWFAFQSFENIGMTLGIMPVAGLPLPFVSYGGSSMFAVWVAIGLLQSIKVQRPMSA